MAAPAPETDTAVLRKTLSKYRHPVNQIHEDEATRGEKAADVISHAIGTWRFLIIQGILIIAWVVANGVLLASRPFDPFPFIFLNLLFTIQAAYTGPVLLLAGNRSAQHDRLRLEHTAEIEEASERVTLQILKEIERNTEATLKVLEHIQKSKGQAAAKA